MKLVVGSGTCGCGVADSGLSLAWFGEVAWLHAERVCTILQSSEVLVSVSVEAWVLSLESNWTDISLQLDEGRRDKASA